MIKNEDWRDLFMFEKWLSGIAFVHKVFSAFNGERKEEDRISIFEAIKFECERNETNAKPSMSVS